MKKAIIDCYTDEPSGLGVPPFLGIYPRYIAGKEMLEGNKPIYLTIDDLRLEYLYGNKLRKKQKTDIRIYNLTTAKGIKTAEKAGNKKEGLKLERAKRKSTREIIEEADELIFISGIHVPGKYLSAVPGSLAELRKILEKIKEKASLGTAIAGPAASSLGTQQEGGKKAISTGRMFGKRLLLKESYKELSEYAIKGAEIVEQIPYESIAEIETARGCSKSPGCSFCTEPIKSSLEFRDTSCIISEAKELAKKDIKDFRLGKQSDFFLWKGSDIKKMLSGIRKIKSLRTLHIDNIDPATTTEEKVKLVAKYCTEGNVAALGIETFDEDVVEANSLHSQPEASLEAIRIINKHGSLVGRNGMQKFLPGINLIFGLYKESKKTHERNMMYLRRALKEKLLVRRINIRQLSVYKGTPIEKLCGTKYLRKNKKYYWKWRNEIRQEIDNKMLKRLVPEGTVLRDIRIEVHDGNASFGRQLGTYPLIVGIKKRLKIGAYYNIAVKGHMLRSIVGELTERNAKCRKGNRCEKIA